MEQRRTWKRELSENGLLYLIAAAMVSTLYTLGRWLSLSLAPAILIITSLNFIPHLA